MHLFLQAPKNIAVKRDRAPQGVKPVKSEDGNDEPEEENQSFLRKYVRAVQEGSLVLYVASVLTVLWMSFAVVHHSAYRRHESVRRRRRRPPAGGAGGAPPAAGGRRR